MKPHGSFVLIALLILALSLAPGSSGLAQAAGALLRPGGPGPAWAAPLFATTGTAFTYQGSLQDGGSPANGAYDFQFLLFDAATAGSQVGSTVTLNDVNVVNGLFTVQLDFGGVFDGTALWLEVRVRAGASTGGYTILAPRQPLTATPYALYSLKAPWSGLTGVPAGFADGVDNDTTYSAGTGLTLSGTTFALNTGYTDGRYWKLTGNAGTDPATNFLGTTDNQPLEIRVNNQRALRIEPTTGTPNLIGGFSGNMVTLGVVGATIGGGGTSANTNRVTDDFGTVGGGTANQAGDDAGTTTDKAWATVGGGRGNTASGDSATVGGGSGNIASGDNATVGGGTNNVASGTYATVPGGIFNVAAGAYSFAAGNRAVANHDGAFVWGDSTLAFINSPAANTFIVRANGGTWFGQATTAYTPTVSGGYFTIQADGQPDLVLGGGSNTVTGDDGILSSQPDYPSSDLIFYTNDAFAIYLNKDGSTGEDADFEIYDDAGSLIFNVDMSGRVDMNGPVYVNGTLVHGSDRNAKERVVSVDTQEVLEKVAAMPLYEWSYKGQGARHLGPMAQDFYAAFGLGDTDKGIATVDADGVALAAIQGLYQQVQEQTAQIARLRAENEALRAEKRRQQAQIAALEARLDALERDRSWARLPGAAPWAGLGLLAGVILARRRKEVER